MATFHSKKLSAARRRLTQLLPLFASNVNLLLPLKFHDLVPLWGTF